MRRIVSKRLMAIAEQRGTDRAIEGIKGKKSYQVVKKTTGRIKRVFNVIFATQIKHKPNTIRWHYKKLKKEYMRNGIV